MNSEILGYIKTLRIVNKREIDSANDVNKVLDVIEEAILKAQKNGTDKADISNQITREELIQIINDIYGHVDNFLDLIEGNNVPTNFTVIYQEEELYIIDNVAHEYIHWYKKTHIGRDFHTDIKTTEELIEFFKRLSRYGEVHKIESNLIQENN